MTRVQCIECRRRDAIEGKILCPEYRMGNKKPWWNWGVAVCPVEEKA